MDLTIESTVRLNNDIAMPRLGLGVYRSSPGGETRDAIRWALDAGYRHIDTAKAYENERDVGHALRESGLPREDVFVTTKLWNTDHGYDRALAACDASLERLGLDAVDLYLIHWPVPDERLDTWRALERILDEGKARAIGVSNYMTRHLEELLEASDVVPAVNQIELHPYNYAGRRDVVEFCEDREIRVEAYSPVTKGRRLDDPKLVRIAERYGKTPAQVLIRWSLQHGFVVIPKSTNHDRIRENADVFDLELSADDMAALDAFDEGLVLAWDPTEVE